MPSSAAMSVWSEAMSVAVRAVLLSSSAHAPPLRRNVPCAVYTVTGAVVVVTEVDVAFVVELDADAVVVVVCAMAKVALSTQRASARVEANRAMVV